MNSIKTESGDTICRGCLSAERRLLPLAYYELYFSLLDDKQRIEVLRKPYILMCWECDAILRRFQTFRGQVQRAHTVLEESVTTPAKDTLSRLNIRIKDKYDACFEESTQFEENPYFRAPSFDSIKYETPRTELEETENDKNIIKVEKAINVRSKPCVPPKKRKLKNKTIEKKKRKSLEDPEVTNLKVEKSKKKKKVKMKEVDIEVCNVNENQNEKVEIKVERISDIEENHWTQELAFEDQTNDESDFSSKDGKERKDDKKRIFTFKKTITHYGEDVLSYFTEVEMSEEEMKNILENQVEIVNNSKPHKCEFCGLRFKQKKTLNGHVSHSHRKALHKDQIKKEPDGARDRYFLYRCCYCDRMLRKEHTQSHLHEFHRHKYRCLMCTWSEAFFWNKEDQSNHWQTVHAQLVCDICRQTRRNTHDMERHMRASHLPIKCPQCPRVYSKWKYYRQHQKMAHPVLALEPPESRYCVECDMQFPSIMAYKMHVMNQHRSTPKKRWPCPACDKTLNNKDTMKKHYALFHSDKTSYQCPHCGKYLSSKSSLQHHLNSHLNIKLPKDKLCSVCGRGFSTKRMLRFHTYTHTGERPYSCPHCPAAFTQPNPLRLHARKQHPHLPTLITTNPQAAQILWPCPACDKTLNNKDTMKKHYALFHSEKTSYQCPHCGKYLSSKCSLRHHLNSHLNIKLPKDKLCSVCGRGFSTKRMLRFHTYTHTGERPYSCPHCPAAFTQPNPLRLHARKQHPHLPTLVRTNPQTPKIL